MSPWPNMLLERFFGLLDYVGQGGGVMFPLIGVSLWMWLLIVKKLVELYWGAARPWAKVEQGLPGDAPSASAGSEEAALMAEFRRLRTFDARGDKKAIKALLGKRQSEMESHIQTIFVLGFTAPLLGLLGTVTGMIETFEAIHFLGTANAEALAKGISSALITTQTGLVVALPGLLMGHILRRRAENMQVRMSRFALRVGRRAMVEDRCSTKRRQEGVS